MLVRAKDGSSVAAVQREIEQKFPNAEVASQKQVTDQISGSLVDASNLSHRLGVALAILAALAAFLLAALLDALVGRQARARDRDAEGARLDAAARAAADRRRVGGAGDPRRAARRRARRRSPRPRSARSGRRSTATSTTGGGAGAFGLGQLTARTVSDQISLTAPLAPTVLLFGFLLAVVGGLIAGAAGAFRAARLRPADALRTVE